jgi:hypothetical protein
MPDWHRGQSGPYWKAPRCPFMTQSRHRQSEFAVMYPSVPRPDFYLRRYRLARGFREGDYVHSILLDCDVAVGSSMVCQMPVDPVMERADPKRTSPKSGSQFLAPLIVETRRRIAGDRLAMAEPGSIE